ncbi:DNA polymerase III subunit delta' [Vibrio sp. Sgm 22]|uniref:DNA polymerase III subunit delta' n=1 Tax=unclassified Vibrio TaxID=2614977 RepID=UPI002249791B|nr:MULTISPECIES: DNA polymerase III subunit delta' [unclassified Vibrio]MCX2759476.1 DNA polymerase III subunit delta' [Vibrio sp. 14G-20]MCX2776195.1 DNA polymerase III subunit delta' [Vibrio sp. Sgm 22]
MAEVYSWLTPVWSEWKKSLDAERFPNSVIVNAPEGLGVDALISQLTDVLMCTNYENESCGFCHSCELMKSGSHPDFHVISPEKEGKAITVDQVRASNRWAQQSSQLGGLRVILLNPAEAMNESASNALLKTLEEPSSKCIFILSTRNSNRLMPTIISRCQQFNVVSPQLEAGSAWLDGEVGKAVPQYILALNDNAPLKAKAMFEQGGVEASTKALDGFVNVIKGTQPDMLKFSTELSKDPLIQLGWLWHLLSDVQKLHFDLATQAMTPSAKALVEVMSYQNAYAASNKLLILIEQLKQHPGLNTELLIMNWLIATCEETCS